MGEHDRALEILSQSVAQYERSGAKVYLQAFARRGRSYVHGEGGSQVGPFLSGAGTQSGQRDEQYEEAAIWAGNLSECYSELRDWANADTFNREAIRLKSAANMHTLYYNVLNAARIARGRGDSAEATRLYEQAMDEGKNDPSVVWEAHAGLGAVALQQHQPAAAVQHFEAAVNQSWRRPARTWSAPNSNYPS